MDTGVGSAQASIRAARLLFLAFVGAILVSIFVPTADAGTRYSVTNVGSAGGSGSAFNPSNSPDQVGGGVLLTNKPLGYYMGRAFNDSSFDQISPLSKRGTNYGRSVTSGSCGWLGPAGGVSIVADYLGKPKTASNVNCPDTGALSVQSAIGSAFNCSEGSGLGPQRTTLRMNTRFYYNVYWSNTIPNRILGAVTSNARDVYAGAVVGYRFQNGGFAAVYVPGLGWGFVETNSLTSAPSGSWSYTSNLDQQFACDKFVAISTPSHNQLVAGPVVNVQYHWSSTSRSRSVTCAFDSGAMTSCPGQSATSPPLTDGIHTFVAFTHDATGSVTSIDSRLFRVDSTPPTIDLTSPQNNATVGRPFTISGTVTDANGVASTVCRIDSTTTCSLGASTSVKVGAHTLSITATDSVGNTSTKAVSFTVVAPTVTITRPLEGEEFAGAEVLAEFTASGQYDRFECIIDYDPRRIYPCGSPYTITGLTPGVHVLLVRVYDGESWTADAVVFYTT